LGAAYRSREDYWIERCAAQRHASETELRIDRINRKLQGRLTEDGLHGEPRYKELLRRKGLLE
jgi:hypothetical protein